MFGAKPELSQDDVLIVRSDDYEPSTPPLSTEPGNTGGSLNGKDVLAVISAMSNGSNNCAKIALEGGSTWLSNLMSNGSYEFTHIDDQGGTTTARWVRRYLASTRNSSASIGPANTPTVVSQQPAEYKWTFSIIDPSSKRHPIMGNLTSKSVEIYDTYTTLPTSGGRYSPTPPFGPGVSSDYREPVSPSASRKDERETAVVTWEQKKLMLATAAWIGLQKQG